MRLYIDEVKGVRYTDIVFLVLTIIQLLVLLILLIFGIEITLLYIIFFSIFIPKVVTYSIIRYTLVKRLRKKYNQFGFGIT